MMKDLPISLDAFFFKLADKMFLRLKSSETKFYGLMRQRLTFTKVMGRLMCGERKDLLMIPNTQAHL